MAQIEAWLAQGIRRVILGTVALRDPDLVQRGLPALSGPIVVGIDAKGGQGRGRRLGRNVRHSRRSNWRSRFEDAGVAAIIFTDIDRDGILKGINIDSTLELAARDVPFRSSPRGGLASIDGYRAPAAARLRHSRRRDLRPRAL